MIPKCQDRDATAVLLLPRSFCTAITEEKVYSKGIVYGAAKVTAIHYMGYISHPYFRANAIENPLGKCQINN